MSFLTLIQIVFDVVVIVGVALFFLKRNQPQKDDPRLSRGLQLLQSKISILEDLSDRVETQFKQLSAILEEKKRDVHESISESEEQINRIHQSMKRSLEVAKIFQDRIPHEEIIERRNTEKYIQAAKMSHEGKSASEISQALDLPEAEVEFISSVNRDELIFEGENLPEWVK